MSESPSGIDTEVLNAPTIIKESIILASKDRVDIETTKEQLANYFEEYAYTLGFKGEEAKGSQKPTQTFQAQVYTVTNHELRHLLQHMVQPDTIRRKTKQDLASQKLIIGLGTALFVGGIVPETLPYTLGGLAGLKCITLLEYGKGINTEKDPIEAQKIDMSQLQRKPFNFTGKVSI